MLTSRGARVVTVWLFILGFMVGLAWGQESAPYSITNENPLVIDRADDAPVDLAGFLERVDSGRARTNGTRDGFDFRCAADRGQGWTGLVYRVGDGPTMRAAVELPGGHLGEPEEYSDSPWDWADVQVFDGPIAVTSESIGADPDCVRPEGVSLAVAGVGGAGPQPNQSFLVKQMQRTLAGCLANMFSEMANSAYGVFDGGNGNLGNWVTRTPSDWRISNQVFHYTAGGAWIKFSNARWDPGSSEMHYGPVELAHKVEEQNAAKTKLIQNGSDVPVHVSYSETESITNTYSMAVTKGMTLDMSVDSTQEVGGSYAGVEAKVSVSEHFGVSETSEQSQEKSHEGTHEESLTIEFDANPHEYYLVTLSKEHETTTQDFAIHGVMDFAIELGWGGSGVGARQRDRRAGLGDTTKLASVAEFDQFVHGFDTDYPSMQGFWETAYPATRYGIYCLTEPEHGHRTLSVSGVNTNTLESNADYKVESLGGSVPDAYKHLPVEDAADVGQ